MGARIIDGSMEEGKSGGMESWKNGEAEQIPHPFLLTTL
jgi:hypothetical protein